MGWILRCPRNWSNRLKIREFATKCLLSEEPHWKAANRFDIFMISTEKIREMAQINTKLMINLN